MDNNILEKNKIDSHNNNVSDNNSNDDATLQNRNLETKVIAFSIISGIMYIAVTALCIWTFVFRTVPKTYEINLELGEEVPQNVSFYVTGADFRLKNTSLNTSEVNNYREGMYPVYLTINDKDYLLQMVIKDTVAPVIEANQNIEYLELGKEYTFNDFFDGITEASRCFDVKAYINDKPVGATGVFYYFYAYYPTIVDADSRSIFFDYTGCYNLKFLVTDSAGNTSGYSADYIVKDTTAPQITFSNEDRFYKTDEAYSVRDFVDIYDASCTEQSYFVVDGVKTETLNIPERGCRQITIVSYDESGNEAELTFDAEFDDAPIFIGIHDGVIALNSEVNPAYYVSAVDSMDGNVSDNIQVDYGNFDPGVSGTYTITYYVTDSNGLTSTATENITVADKNSDNSSENNSGISSDNTLENSSGNNVVILSDYLDYVLTDAELDYLTEYDYFSYEPLAEDDYQCALSLVYPTLVNMKYTHNGNYVAGSGFIYRIDRDYIYIVSCKHVLAYMTGDTNLVFCDGSSCTVSVSVSDYIVMSDEMETAMFRIPVSVVPYYVLLNIREAYVDEEIYDDLDIGQELFAYSGHYINRDELVKITNYQSCYCYFDYDASCCVEANHKLVEGMSGCPLFDECGRVVGVAEGYKGIYNYSTGSYDFTDYYMMIDGLEELYTRVRG